MKSEDLSRKRERSRKVTASGDDALVSLRLQKDDGKTKDEGYQFRRTGDGWRLVVPGKAVDKLGKKLADPPKK